MRLGVVRSSGPHVRRSTVLRADRHSVRVAVFAPPAQGDRPGGGRDAWAWMTSREDAACESTRRVIHADAIRVVGKLGKLLGRRA